MTKLTNKQLAILDLLSANSSMYGLDMVKASSLLTRGAIYVILNHMEDEGWVASVQEDGGRRTYSITDAGRAALKDC